MVDETNYFKAIRNGDYNSIPKALYSLFILAVRIGSSRIPVCPHSKQDSQPYRGDWGTESQRCPCAVKQN